MSETPLTVRLARASRAATAPEPVRVASLRCRVVVAAAISAVPGPVASDARRDLDPADDAIDHVVDRLLAEAGVGREDEAVRKDRLDQRLHVVGDHVLPPL